MRYRVEGLGFRFRFLRKEEDTVICMARLGSVSYWTEGCVQTKLSPLGREVQPFRGCLGFRV